MLESSPLRRTLSVYGAGTLTGVVLGLIASLILAALSAGSPLASLLLVFAAELGGKRYAQLQAQAGDFGFAQFLQAAFQAVTFTALVMTAAFTLDSLLVMALAPLAGLFSPLTLEQAAVPGR